MIKAVVLDIDGVIVGSKDGINFPHPSKKVLSALKKIADSGIPVSFLTAKPTFSAWENIKKTGIDNAHIADGGATIFNPIQNKIIKSVIVQTEDLKLILGSLPDNTYVNLFSNENYYLRRDLKNNFTNVYSTFVMRMPKLIKDMDEVIEKELITKANIIAFNANEKELITKAINNTTGSFNHFWTTIPKTDNIPVMVITAKGVTKCSGLKNLAEYLNVSTREILGVGDTINDWIFIEACGYKAVMGNATEDLKDKIRSNDPRQVIGGHVDEDGILDVFKYFGLI